GPEDELVLRLHLVELDRADRLGAAVAGPGVGVLLAVEEPPGDVRGDAHGLVVAPLERLEVETLHALPVLRLHARPADRIGGEGRRLLEVPAEDRERGRRLLVTGPRPEARPEALHGLVELEGVEVARPLAEHGC